jgi:cell wall-associated NlpC family hydrolase
MMRFPGHPALAVCVLALATGACATSSPRTAGRPVAAPRPFPSPAGTLRPTVPANGDDGRRGLPDAVVTTALTLRGIPYRNGGSDPGGFDCSGFTQYVFARSGVALPRAVEEQFQVGRNVKSGDLESGDLVFFRTVSNGPSHVGIAIGGDQFIHAPSSNGVVRIERLSADYWSRRFMAARRIQ